MNNKNQVRPSANIGRRAFAGLTLAALATETARAASAPPGGEAGHGEYGIGMPPARSPVTVAMLVYPDMVLQDLVGPQTILKLLGADIHLVGMDMTPVRTDIGIPVPPTDTPETCPHALDVLFVPGGLIGTIACMNRPEVLEFLKSRAGSARFVTSVCTGSLILAAAGLLRGYRATSHWGVVDLLPLMGARESRERVVVDRNRMTGGGVTAGIDFGLSLAAQLRGQVEAEHVQLVIQYAPQPPFRHGEPSDISSGQMAVEWQRRAGIDRKAREAAEIAARRLAI
ncbi:DJ-1/PfpI family protein [Gluconacetobacter sp. Hr-1-5]|uniref:DJ-1/PfpI family protein n=1 Tax=Gluconacetobacter sp. Hr-1-5 TaxID=3395370 RepID=UPI003B521F16